MKNARTARPADWRGWVIPLGLLLLWEISAHRQWVSSLLLVPIENLYRAALDPVLRESLTVGLMDTFTRLLQGAAIGVVLGLIFGTFLGLSHSCDRIMGPSFHAVRQVAVFAWIPLLTAWFGIGPICKILFVAIAAFKPVVMGTYEGIRNVPTQYLEVGEVLCFSRLRMLRTIILPAAAPSIVTALQLALIFSWVAAIGAEYVIGAMSGGIGSVVSTAQEHFRTDVVLLGVILISTVGILLNKGLRLLPRYLFKWREV